MKEKVSENGSVNFVSLSGGSVRPAKPGSGPLGRKQPGHYRRLATPAKGRPRLLPLKVNFKTIPGKRALTMKNKRIYYFGLLAALLFGFGLTTLPALGNDLPVCVGSNSGTSVQIKLGGRSINPSSLLEAKSLDQACSEGETNIRLVEHTRTITISPKGSPAENGATLRQIVNFSQPTMVDRRLIKLEPGYYDLGGQSLNMKPFLDLEGSGERVTFITSDVSFSTTIPTGGVINAASDSTIRFLGIGNGTTGAVSKTAVFVPNSVNFFQLYKVGISAPNTSQYNYGLVNLGNITVSDTSFSVGAADHNIGIHNSGTITLNDSVMNINGVISDTTINWGFNNTGNGSATINNSQLNVYEGGQTAGVRNNSGKDVTVLNSFINARGGTARNAGLEASDSTIIASNSTIKAYNTQSYGLFSSNGASIRLANSQVAFTTGSVFGSAQCVYAVNINNYSALNTNCQSS